MKAEQRILYKDGLSEDEIGAQDLDKAETDAKSVKTDNSQKLEELLNKLVTTRRRRRRSRSVAAG